MALTAVALLFSELLIEVFRVNGLALAAGDDLGQQAGLTSARWQVLGVVDHGPAPVAQVARTMGLRRQSVQVTADALARDGFVSYADNPHHRRAKLITITAAGRTALRALEARHAPWAHRLGKGVGLDTLRTTLAGLRAARQQLEADAVNRDQQEG
jgi:DNA-binding MarR family transcriptional regulator